VFKKSSLLQKLQTPSNLRASWYEINRSNRFSSGLSRITIEDFFSHLNENLRLIRRQLKNGEYVFSPVKGIPIFKKQIHERSKKPKKRGIRIAEVRDRVVQRGIARIIEPFLFKKYQLDNGVSFAYLSGRGVRQALNQMVVYYLDGNPIVFEADIVKFFDTVDRKKLLEEMVFPGLPDESINGLISDALNQEIGNWSKLSNEDKSLFPDSGIPQGGGLSPLFANVYLYKFDKIMQKHGYKLIRYADDFIIMCADKTEALNAHDLAKQIIEGSLKLKMHELNIDNSGKTRIIQITQDVFEFLGTRFNGRRLWPSSQKVQIVTDRIREITEFTEEKTLLRTLNELKSLIEGWVSAYCHTDLEPYAGMIDETLRNRLGVFLHLIGWKNKRDSLTEKQLDSSGIQSISVALEMQREKMNSLQRESFSGLWTKQPIAQDGKRTVL
jgi:RNA-directed DNA polymerase